MSQRVFSPRAANLLRQRFGKLVVTARNGYRGKHAAWLALCDCGKQTIATTGKLRRGRVKSCGCLKLTAAGDAVRTHGMWNTSLYHRWQRIIQRCEYPRVAGWSRYGGRGITVCPEWRNSPKAFIDWALANGYQPHLQIDRIDNDGNYEPANCRWVTPSVNMRNRGLSKREAPSRLHAVEK